MNIIVYQITIDYYNTTDTYNTTTDTYSITTKILWKYYRSADLQYLHVTHYSYYSDYRFHGKSQSLLMYCLHMGMGRQLSTLNEPIPSSWVILMGSAVGVWIYCSLTFYINFKPLIIKISWELNKLCYILWN